MSVSENIIITQHPDYKKEIAGIIRSDLTPRHMREQLLAYHENDMADVLEYSEQPDSYIGEITVRGRRIYSR